MPGSLAIASRFGIRSAPRDTSPFGRTRNINGRSSISAEQLALGSLIAIPTDLERKKYARVPRARTKSRAIALSLHASRRPEAGIPIRTDYAENPTVGYGQPITLIDIS